MNTEILDQIDSAVTAWEARPESWLPGDPLYEPRSYATDPGVRPMIQLRPDSTWTIPPRCEPCQVAWAGDDACWVCGEERPDPTIRVANFADLTAFVEAADRAAEGMRETYERMAETLTHVDWSGLKATLDKLDRQPEHQPGPLSIDGHAYRRRTRNRRGRR